jgi:chromosome segregation ATPase
MVGLGMSSVSVHAAAALPAVAATTLTADQMLALALDPVGTKDRLGALQAALLAIVDARQQAEQALADLDTRAAAFEAERSDVAQGRAALVAQQQSHAQRSADLDARAAGLDRVAETNELAAREAQRVRDIHEGGLAKLREFAKIVGTT